MQWYDLDAVNQQNPLAHINYLEAELIAQTVQTKQFDVGKKAGSCTDYRLRQYPGSLIILEDIISRARLVSHGCDQRRVTAGRIIIRKLGK